MPSSVNAASGWRPACRSKASYPGDRVAYLSFNTHQLLEGYFGVLLAGAIVMPLNVRLTPAELAGILNHAEPRVLIYEPDFAPLVDALRPSCPQVRRWIETGAAYEELLARGRLERPDPFSIDENAICRTVLYQRLHRHSQRRDAVAPHLVPARALGCVAALRARTTTRWSCTPSPYSTPTDGAARTPPP